MKQLWAPWRMEFISEGTKEPGCVFCRLFEQKTDRENLILYRAKKSFVIMNKYPYNNGHVMVVPNRHTADLSALDAAEMSEIWEFGRHTVQALKEAYGPEGYNLGMNLGRAGGAGIKDHLHLHIVPRWEGDTNFMPVIADTKSMPQHILASYDLIQRYFGRLKP